MASKHALAIRHLAFEDLGLMDDVLRQQGWTISYADAGIADFTTIDPLAADLLVILGGPIGAYEDDIYPFLNDEIALIQKRLAAQKPIIGICLGAQLMARALGARVYPGQAKEIGWAPLILTEAGKQSPLGLVGELSVLHWHGDTFDLPDGATLLASTPITTNQAFVLGRHALGLQFHLEVKGSDIERWLIGHTGEISATPGVSVPGLRQSTKIEAPLLEPVAHQIIETWLHAARLS